MFKDFNIIRNITDLKIHVFQYMYHVFDFVEFLFIMHSQGLKVYLKQI